MLTNCLGAVEHWLSLSKLKLNRIKTQGIVFSQHVSKFAADKFDNNFSAPRALKYVKNIGGYCFHVCDMSTEEQIKSTVKECYF